MKRLLIAAFAALVAWPAVADVHIRNTDNTATPTTFNYEIRDLEVPGFGRVTLPPGSFTWTPSLIGDIAAVYVDASGANPVIVVQPAEDPRPSVLSRRVSVLITKPNHPNPRWIMQRDELVHFYGDHEFFLNEVIPANDWRAQRVDDVLPVDYISHGLFRMEVGAGPGQAYRYSSMAITPKLPHAPNVNCKGMSSSGNREVTCDDVSLPMRPGMTHMYFYCGNSDNYSSYGSLLTGGYRIADDT